MQDQTILEIRQLSRESSGFVAVKNVSLKVRQGSPGGGE
jgi:ABC-type branched-subunit amino acid transport system ATPase component